jgi:hypothetical protein
MQIKKLARSIKKICLTDSLIQAPSPKQPQLSPPRPKKAPLNKSTAMKVNEKQPKTAALNLGKYPKIKYAPRINSNHGKMYAMEKLGFQEKQHNCLACVENFAQVQQA